VRGAEGHPVAIGVGELEDGLPHLEAVDGVDEVGPVRRPAELAVGDEAQPEALLHGDGGGDGLVLGPDEACFVKGSGPVPAVRVPQGRRAQEAADVVGPYRIHQHRWHYI
jgi:hypothetical protein